MGRERIESALLPVECVRGTYTQDPPAGGVPNEVSTVADCRGPRHAAACDCAGTQGAALSCGQQGRDASASPNRAMPGHIYADTLFRYV